jgi:pantoate--beta-alanine ligase
MEIVDSVSRLRQAVQQCRSKGNKIALVPTMGNLHAGHIHLVEQARCQADYVVVSIFVNPTQFGVGEDFASYPRTVSQDQLKLEQSGADLLFLPEVEQIYPHTASTMIVVKNLSEILCGASRPGHFSGVATIVGKLFNMVQADVAVFGEKDYQQLAVIRQMVKDLNFDVAIFPVATVREADGLAMSSRNSYLAGKHRRIAPMLYQSLCQAKHAIMAGDQSFDCIEQLQTQNLFEAGFEVDYFSIRRQEDLQAAEATDTELIILVAAKLGKSRLIDNILLSRTVLTA